MFCPIILVNRYDKNSKLNHYDLNSFYIFMATQKQNLQQWLIYSKLLQIVFGAGGRGILKNQSYLLLYKVVVMGEVTL